MKYSIDATLLIDIYYLDERKIKERWHEIEIRTLLASLLVV